MLQKLWLRTIQKFADINDIAGSDRQPPAPVHEANSLNKKLDQLETALISIMWNDILQKINLINKSLQEAGIGICTVVKLYESLLSYFQAIRNNFDDYETQAKELVSSDYIQSSCRKRTRKIMFDEGATPEVEMNPRDTFRTQTFYVIVDKLLSKWENASKLMLE